MGLIVVRVRKSLCRTEDDQAVVLENLRARGDHLARQADPPARMASTVTPYARTLF